MQSLWEILDVDGHIYQYANETLDHKRCKDTMPNYDGYFISKNDQKKKRIICICQELFIKQMDGLQICVPLVDLKESYHM